MNSDNDQHDDFGGLQRDLAATMNRRRLLQGVAALGAAGLLAACKSDSSQSDSTQSGATQSSPAQSGAAQSGSTQATSAASTSVAASPGVEIPDETQGPYPADGSNQNLNVLGVEGINRQDMTTSFGDYSGTADGVPVSYQLTVLDATTGDALPDHALYIWHCTADGQYSLYEVTDQNYLRALQVTDGTGQVTFNSIYPGCYAGRWPHAHFEIFDGVQSATAGRASVKTSQLALPKEVCETVYTDSRYGSSASNLQRLSLTTDNVFSDGWESQLATVTGSNDVGYTVSLQIRI